MKHVRYSGEPIGGVPAKKAELDALSSLRRELDCRDVAQVMAHDAPLPHPAPDKPQ